MVVINLPQWYDYFVDLLSNEFYWNCMILHLVDEQHVLVYHVMFQNFAYVILQQYQSFQNAQTLGSFLTHCYIEI